MVEEREQRSGLEERIKKRLEKKKSLKAALALCGACGLCADRCFMYQNKKDKTYIPAYKARKSLGILFKKKGAIKRQELEQMGDLVFGKCAMCRRCYCPLGIDVSMMIASARSILRQEGIFQSRATQEIGRTDSGGNGR